MERKCRRGAALRTRLVVGKMLFRHHAVIMDMQFDGIAVPASQAYSSKGCSAGCKVVSNRHCVRRVEPVAWLVHSDETCSDRSTTVGVIVGRDWTNFTACHAIEQLPRPSRRDRRREERAGVDLLRWSRRARLRHCRGPVKSTPMPDTLMWSASSFQSNSRRRRSRAVFSGTEQAAMIIDGFADLLQTDRPARHPVRRVRRCRTGRG